MPPLNLTLPSWVSMPSVDALQTHASTSTDAAYDWIQTIASVLTVEPLAHIDSETLLCVFNVSKDSAFGVMSLCSTVTAFRNCLENGFLSMDTVVALTSGLNAAAAIDRAMTAGISIGVGIGQYGVVTSAFVNITTFITRVRDGDVPGALLTGTKLIATVALTGHPVALGIVIAADLTYTMYWKYQAMSASAWASMAEDEQPLLASDDELSWDDDVPQRVEFAPLQEVLAKVAPPTLP